MQASLRVSSRTSKWHRNWSSGHLLHRAMSDAGGALLDYDVVYCLHHYAIILYPVDIFFQNVSRILKWAQVCCQLLSGVSLRWGGSVSIWETWMRSLVIVNGLQEGWYWWQSKFVSIFCHSLVFSVDFWYMASCTQFAGRSTTTCIRLRRMLVGLCFILFMNTSYLMIFLGWFLNRNSDIPRSFVRNTAINNSCLSRCSVLHQTKRDAGYWKI